MIFHCENNNGDFGASPFAVSVGHVRLYYTTTNSFPVVVTLGNEVCFGTPGGEHQDLLARLKITQTKAEGRFWKGENVLTVWDVDSDPTPEVMSLIANAFHKRLGIPSSMVRFFVDCSIRQDEKTEEWKRLVVEMSLKEYLTLNIPGNRENFFWDLYEKENKLSDEKGDIAQNGMSSKDIWRHYQNLGENTIRLNESQLRRKIEESVRSILKEILE